MLIPRKTINWILWQWYTSSIDGPSSGKIFRWDTATITGTGTPSGVMDGCTEMEAWGSRHVQFAQHTGLPRKHVSRLNVSSLAWKSYSKGAFLKTPCALISNSLKTWKFPCSMINITMYMYSRNHNCLKIIM